MRRLRRPILLSLLLWLPLAVLPARAGAEDFPVPERLQPAVAFWKRVYLEASTDGGLLHDARRLSVVYEVLRFEPKAGQRARQRQIDRRR
jgi:membrane-bound lytic murein transglycosylase D